MTTKEPPCYLQRKFNNNDDTIENYIKYQRIL